MHDLYKSVACLLLCFAAIHSFAQKQPVDSFLQQYHVKFYSLPGLPDSIWYNIRFDTTLHRLKKGDTTLTKQRAAPMWSDSLLDTTVLFSSDSSATLLNWLISVLSIMLSVAKSVVVPFIR